MANNNCCRNSRCEHAREMMLFTDPVYSFRDNFLPNSVESRIILCHYIDTDKCTSYCPNRCQSEDSYYLKIDSI